MFYVNVDKKYFSNLEEINGIKKILTSYLNIYFKNIISEHISDVEVHYTDTDVVFVPNSLDNLESSVNGLESVENVENIELQQIVKTFIGYTLLSDNTLAKYIVNDIGIDKVKYLEHLALITLESEKQLLLDDNKYFNLNNYKDYFSYNVENIEDWDTKYIEQLCRNFKVEIKSKDEKLWILKRNGDSNLYINFNWINVNCINENWLNINLSRVKKGLYPNVIIATDCSENIKLYSNDYERRYGEPVYYKYIIKYCALFAFAELSDEYPEIKHEIYNVNVKSNYSINLNLPTLELTEKYTSIFWRMYLNGTQYRFEYCEDFKEGIVKRYIIQKTDSDAYPIMFSLGKKKNIIVYRGLSEPNFKNLSDMENKLRNETLKWAMKCHDNYEAVSLEKIKDLSLPDLLSLISITENRVTYCFTKSNLEKIKYNPLTRKTFSQKTEYEIMYYDYGIRGLYNVGVLYGLLSEVAIPNIFLNNLKNLEELQNNLEKDIIKITRISNRTEIETKLLGNVFLVQVLTNKKNVTGENIIEIYDLFEICLPKIELNNIDKLRDYVNVLWNKGFFLDDWQKFIYKKDFVISNTPLMDVLKYSKYSIADGMKALEYLNSLID